MLYIVLFGSALYAPQHGKTYLLIRAHNEDSNQAVHQQSDQSLRCPHEKNFAYLAIQIALSEGSDHTADQNLCWKQMSEGHFSDVGVYMCGLVVCMFVRARLY